MGSEGMVQRRLRIWCVSTREDICGQSTNTMRYTPESERNGEMLPTLSPVVGHDVSIVTCLMASGLFSIEA